ncbi:ABC transporter permease [Candidatus Magnetaquicoccus inordinatus]|uniref:ABC transporter permease n=1 Tax=Candidatus Magnetaquicoccus inordinatus TaxID=2496818 RepID=UPI00102CD4A5|nr:FtsX-like permease family protein [Candidatus Magnetaquicoccus inordinatus]
MITAGARVPLTLTQSNSRYVAATILLCVTILVAVLASAQMLQGGMAANARNLLGADLRLQATWPLPAEEGGAGLPSGLLHFAQQQLSAANRHFSPSLEFNAMARPLASEHSLLVEVKAVAANYPLRGQVQLQDDLSLAQALAGDGIVVEASLLHRLNLSIGQSLVLGEAQFTIRGVLAFEPDRITRLFRLGPGVLMPLHRVAETALLQMGSRVTQVVGVRLAAGEEASSVANSVRALAQQQGVRLLTPEQSQPSVRRFIRRFILFLAITSLLTLLLGGLAIHSALASWLQENRQNIAILKLLGADNSQLTRLILGALWRMSGWPALLGSLLGNAVPALLPYVVPEIFPAETLYHPSWGLALGGFCFGVLFSLSCVLLPLRQSHHLSPVLLWRLSAGSVAPAKPPRQTLLAVTWLALLMVLLAVTLAVWSGESRAALFFVAGLLVALAVAWVVAQALLWLVRRWQPPPGAWRLACQALLRRGGGQAALLMALGSALGMVNALFFLEENLNQQLLSRLPQRIPSFFFIDLQRDQLQPFRALAKQYAVADEEALRLFPTVRGRLLQEHGQPSVDEADPSRNWRQAREYVLTFAEQLPSGNRLLQGSWWSDPTVLEASVEGEMAKEMGWQLGDQIRFMVHGVEVSARISNLRVVRWSDFSLNFFVIFSPAVLQQLSHSWLASLVSIEGREESLLAELNRQLPNVTAVATRQVLETIHGLVQQVAVAARTLGVAAVLAGLLLLGVQVSAARRQRVREMALYRLLGATRGEVARILAAEMAIVALVAALLGLLIGQLLTLLIVRGIFNDLAIFAPFSLLLAGLCGGSVIFAAAWWSSRRHLALSPMQAFAAGLYQ